MSSSAVLSALQGRTLISEELFDCLTKRIANDENMSPALAARIMDQALAFLATTAQQDGPSLSPSRLVDIGWHTFILYTRDYAEFCHRGRPRSLASTRRHKQRYTRRKKRVPGRTDSHARSSEMWNVLRRR